MFISSVYNVSILEAASWDYIILTESTSGGVQFGAELEKTELLLCCRHLTLLVGIASGSGRGYTEWWGSWARKSTHAMETHNLGKRGRSTETLACEAAEFTRSQITWDHLAGFKLWACGWMAVVQTNQCPFRKDWQLLTWFLFHWYFLWWQYNCNYNIPYNHYYAITSAVSKLESISSLNKHQKTAVNVFVTRSSCLTGFNRSFTLLQVYAFFLLWLVKCIVWQNLINMRFIQSNVS